jgi:hypothetical protein
MRLGRIAVGQPRSLARALSGCHMHPARLRVSTAKSGEPPGGGRSGKVRPRCSIGRARQAARKVQPGMASHAVAYNHACAESGMRRPGSSQTAIAVDTGQCSALEESSRTRRRPAPAGLLGWWAQRARTPFGPAPDAPFAARKGSPRANGRRPYGCELARSKPLPWTLRSGCLDNHCDSQEFIAVRSTVAPQGPSLGLTSWHESDPTSADCQKYTRRRQWDGGRGSEGGEQGFLGPNPEGSLGFRSLVGRVARRPPPQTMPHSFPQSRSVTGLARERTLRVEPIGSGLARRDASRTRSPHRSRPQRIAPRLPPCCVSPDSPEEARTRFSASTGMASGVERSGFEASTASAASVDGQLQARVDISMAGCTMWEGVSSRTRHGSLTIANVASMERNPRWAVASMAPG